MARLTSLQQAFLEGVKHGYRLGRRETQRDVEGLIDELKAVRDEARTKLNAFAREWNLEGAGEPDQSLPARRDLN